MEKIKTEGAAAAADTTTDEVKVVIMGAGPAPEALRKAFPNAEFIDTEAPTGAAEEEAPLEPLAEIGETLAKLRAATREGCGCHKPVIPNPAGKTDDRIRPAAYAKLTSIASEHGVGFNEQELDALYRLSMAFGPKFAIDMAHAACRNFIASWGG